VRHYLPIVQMWQYYPNGEVIVAGYVAVDGVRRLLLQYLTQGRWDAIWRGRPGRARSRFVSALAGVGAGINNTFQQVGFSTGVAVYGTLFTAAITARLSTSLPPGLAAREPVA
jgi:hypothetical protein